MTTPEICNWPGRRITSKLRPTDKGTIVHHIPQVYVEDLYQIRWDNHLDDTDLYRESDLCFSPHLLLKHT